MTMKRRITGLVLITALVTVGMFLWKAQRVTNSIASVAASSAPINPIIAENQKQGTTKWKSPNFDQYINNLMEAERLEHAAKPNPADAGGGAVAPVAWTDTQNVKGY